MNKKEINTTKNTEIAALWRLHHPENKDAIEIVRQRSFLNLQPKSRRGAAINKSPQLVQKIKSFVQDVLVAKGATIPTKKVIFGLNQGCVFQLGDLKIDPMPFEKRPKTPSKHVGKKEKKQRTEERVVVAPPEVVLEYGKNFLRALRGKKTTRQRREDFALEIARFLINMHMTVFPAKEAELLSRRGFPLFPVFSKEVVESLYPIMNQFDESEDEKSEDEKEATVVVCEQIALLEKNKGIRIVFTDEIARYLKSLNESKLPFTYMNKEKDIAAFVLPLLLK